MDGFWLSIRVNLISNAERGEYVRLLVLGNIYTFVDVLKTSHLPVIRKSLLIPDLDKEVFQRFQYSQVSVF